MNIDDLKTYLDIELKRAMLAYNSQGENNKNKIEIYEALDCVQKYLVILSNEYVSMGNKINQTKDELHTQREKNSQLQKYIRMCEILIPIVATIDLTVNKEIIFPILGYLAAALLLVLERQEKNINKKFDSKYSEFMKKKDTVVQNSRNQIAKLKLAKQFIESLTEEELNNYLSYKMGDSNE